MRSQNGLFHRPHTFSLFMYIMISLYFILLVSAQSTHNNNNDEPNCPSTDSTESISDSSANFRSISKRAPISHAIYLDEDDSIASTTPDGGLVQHESGVEFTGSQLTDFLPATAYVIIKDPMTGYIMANSTGFFIEPDVVVTAAHFLEPLRRFHGEITVVSNSRRPSGVKKYKVLYIFVDLENSPCQVLLKIDGNHTDFLPLSKDRPPDGTQVRVVSNSPTGFSGIFQDGVVSRVYDLWMDNSDMQCVNQYSSDNFDWNCEQEKFLVSVPAWRGASGSPVISPTGVVGTLESTGPHFGTSVVASTLGISLPVREGAWVSIKRISPQLLASESLRGSELSAFAQNVVIRKTVDFLGMVADFIQQFFVIFVILLATLIWIFVPSPFSRRYQQAVSGSKYQPN